MSLVSMFKGKGPSGFGYGSAAEDAATQCCLAVHPSVDGVAGKYFSDCNIGKSSSRGRDAEMAAKLWEVSEEIVAEVTA